MAFGLVYLLAVSAGVSRAQDAPLERVAIVPPASDGTSLELASELVDHVSARLEASDRLIVAERPVLPLRDLQFSAGCTTDSVECMKSVADLLEVDTVLVLSVHEEPAMTSLSLVAYDADPPRRRSAMRLATGTDRRSELVADAASMLAELFGIEPTAPAQRARVRPALVEMTVPELQEPHGPSPVGWVFMGTGALTLGAGLALAFVADDTHDAWVGAPARNPAEVDAAIELRERGERELFAATLLVGVGSAALLSGLVIFVIEVLTGGDSDDLVVPHGPGIALNLDLGANQ